MKRWLPVFLLLVGLLCACTAQSQPAQDRPAGYVLDDAQVLSAVEISALESRSRALADATGAELMVVTRDFVRDQTPAEYAKTLADRWALGGKARTGAVLLLVVGEEDAALAVGQGMEAVLPQAELTKMLDDSFWSSLRREDYDAAAEQASRTLADWYRNLYGEDLSKPDTGFRVPVWAWVLLALAAVFVFIKSRYRS